MSLPDRCLICPVCRQPLFAQTRAFRCPAGHCFDRAKEGYLNLLLGKKPKFAGDDAAMLQARRRFLESGVFDPLHELFGQAIGTMGDLPNMHQGAALLSVGCGEGYHLQKLLQQEIVQHLGLYGVGLDLSKSAAKLAARRCRSAQVVVADLHRFIPLATNSTAIICDFFAPRNQQEFARILRPKGRLVIAFPMEEHIQELRERYGLLAIHPEKIQKTMHQFSQDFRLLGRQDWYQKESLSAVQIGNLIAMGPSARHLDLEVLETITEDQPVTLAVHMLCWERREN